MTSPITLESIMEHFRDLLNDAYDIGDFRMGIPDFRAMERLGFTPQSWTRYRPQIIQYCQYNDLIKEEEKEGVTIQTCNIRIKYVPRAKEWRGKRNPLKKIDVETGGYRIMSPEELEKYGIVWFAEQDFLY